LTPNGLVSLDEKELLKHFQQACQKGDVSLARKNLSHWIRTYAPRNLRGNMRDFGSACGEASLQMAIAELDAYGFANDSAAAWKGDNLWTAFKSWKNQASQQKTFDIGDKPKLYPG
jgi:hypothetical protein